LVWGLLCFSSNRKSAALPIALTENVSLTPSLGYM